MNTITVHCSHCLKPVEVEFEKPVQQRTTKQNSSMWKFCELLATALNEAGYDMRTFPWREGLEIPFSKSSVMESLYRPVMESLTGEESTRKQSTVDPSLIYESLMRGLAMKGIDVQVNWPCRETQMNEALAHG